MIEESVLVACLDWIAKEVFAAGIAKCDELSVSLHALWADWSNIVVAYALSDFPLGVVALGFESLRGRCFGDQGWVRLGVWAGWVGAVALPGVVTELVDEPI
jgi:hypothetical protein